MSLTGGADEVHGAAHVEVDEVTINGVIEELHAAQILKGDRSSRDQGDRFKGDRGAHEVDGAAHVEVDEVHINGIIEELHAARHLVRVCSANLHPEAVLAGVSLEQRPLRRLALLGRSLIK